MIEKFLKLRCGQTSVARLQISQPADICGYQERIAEVVRSGSGENVDGFVGSLPSQRNGSPDCWEETRLNLGVRGMFQSKFVSDCFRLHQVAGESERQRRARAYRRPSA